MRIMHEIIALFFPPKHKIKQSIIIKDTTYTFLYLKIKDGTTNEENQVEEVTRIFKVLKRIRENTTRPIPLLKFIIDPTCFSTTVQNMFHTSFLMRDHYVTITLGELINLFAFSSWYAW